MTFFSHISRKFLSFLILTLFTPMVSQLCAMQETTEFKAMHFFLIQHNDPLFIPQIPDEKLNIQDKNGDTLRIHATLNNQYRICDLLLERGADVNLPNNKGYTPLYIAAQLDNYELCLLFLEKGAKTEPGLYLIIGTPLHMASDRGHVKICQLLLDQGAKIIAYQDGDTPLHVAAMFGRDEVCKLLIDKNPSIINAQNKKGNTPLDIAKQLKDKYLNPNSYVDESLQFIKYEELHDGHIRTTELLAQKATQ